MQTRTRHLLDRQVTVVCSGPLRSMVYPSYFQTVNSSVRGMDRKASRSPETAAANRRHRPTDGIGQQPDIGGYNDTSKERKSYPPICHVYIKFNLLAICLHCLLCSWNHKRGHKIVLPIVTSDSDISIRNISVALLITHAIDNTDDNRVISTNAVKSVNQASISHYLFMYISINNT